MKKRTWALLGVLALVVVALIVFGLHKSERAAFELLRETSGNIAQARARSPIGTALVYFVLYVVNGALSLPFGGLLTAAAGAIFGFWWGLAIASVSASVGAVCGLLVSRYLFHGAIERRFGARLAPIHKGLREEGAFYLFALRMVPVFPYWLLNLLMGLTGMRVFTFWWVSTLGLLPLEAAYVFAGTQLASVDQVGLSPQLIAALLALGVLPLLLNRLIRWAERRFFGRKG
ncbi:MAG: TVP38/TMEM64 family protein [Proteobacteria bacterium]|nr:TVP38/TMEM64 family protein [Pseudomonadota bacterium]MBS0462687.1 TVP38/TMEM64 family protein [Pseudomonadota bacterium]MBS0464289.1 TVP38/TMEM64 family protein [Pseudomonadota bacterium]